MNLKRLILSIVAGFIFFFGTDFLVHGIWLAPDYKATASLWRTDAEMQARFGWMVGGHLIFTIAFVLIWAEGYAKDHCLKCSCIYGLLMGLFYQSSTMISYVVSPLPIDIALKWISSGLVQAVLLGVLTFFTYKPLPGKSSGQ